MPPSEKDARPERRGGIQSVHRALSILDHVAVSPGIGVTELAKELDLPASTVHGLAATLVERRYLVKERSGYSVGPASTSLAEHWDPTRSLRPLVEPAARELSARSELAVTAAMLDGIVARIFTYVPSPRPITVSFPQQTRNPLALATGRVLVAFRESSEHSRFLKASTGIESGWDSRMWEQELRTIRSQGVAIRTTNDPRQEVSIAAPIFDARGRALCAIGCSSPSFLPHDLFNHSVLSMLLRTADELTEWLGGTPRARSPIKF